MTKKSRPLRIAVTSLGCPKNLVDTEKMLALLAGAGCLVGAEPDEADVILINTCAFIAPARAESMDAIHAALDRKRRGLVQRVVVAGCLPQKQAAELAEACPDIDAVIGVFNRHEIVKAITGKDRLVRTASPAASCGSDLGRLRLTPRHTAYLRLSEGCNNRCAYCTIPAIRGPLRSKPMRLVLREARELIADGAVELNLIGQDTTAYGRDLSPPRPPGEGRGEGGPGLAKLLRKLNELEGLAWIRLLYAHPAGLTDEIIDALAESPRVAPYIDLPLQHISKSVLGRMKRRYDRRHVEELIDKLRTRIPGVALRTTFIVGFPGEGRREFAELADFVRRAGFDAAGVFAYSREPGTPAADLPNQVRPATAERRHQELMLIQQEIAFAANAARVGQSVRVLVDGPDASGQTIARHSGQAYEIDSVCRLTTPRSAGSFCRGEVVGWNDYDLVVDPE